MDGLVGNSIDLTTGRKLIPDEIDFSLPALMPIGWSRFYACDLTIERAGPYDEYARLLEETDPLGRKITYEYHHLTTLVTKVSYPDASTWQARYDDKGNLLAETDALGHLTEYLNGEDGLPHTIIDATYKSKYLWWNTLAQVERYQETLWAKRFRAKIAVTKSTHMIMRILPERQLVRLNSKVISIRKPLH